jgi:hypothetical protein
VIDYHKELVQALSSVLPTHYEMTLHSGLATPCISYMELNNYVSHHGDTTGYSYITYQVKVWANNIATVQQYAKAVDQTLRPIGFKRISSGELYDNNSTMIQKILTYEALAREDY